MPVTRSVLLALMVTATTLLAPEAASRPQKRKASTTPATVVEIAPELAPSGIDDDALHDDATNDETTNDDATNDDATNDDATTDDALHDDATNDDAAATDASPNDTPAPRPPPRKIITRPAVVDDEMRIVLELTLLGDSAPSAPTSLSAALFSGRPAYLWAGLRGGVLKPVTSSIVLGGDVGVGASRFSQGNSQVGETWNRVVLEGRGLVGTRFTMARAALIPYALVSGRLEAGLANLTVLSEPRFKPLGGIGMRLGIGLMMEIGYASFRFDCAPGVRTWSVDVGCSLGTGVSF